MKVGDLVRIRPEYQVFAPKQSPVSCVVTAVFEDEDGMTYCRLHSEYWYKDYELELLSECGRLGKSL